MNALIVITPPAPLNAEQTARNTAHRETTTLANIGVALLDCLGSTRATGAAVLYAGGPAAAQARFSSQPNGGAPLVAADLVARLLAGLYDPAHPAAASPLPPGIDIVVRDASGDPVDIAAVAVALQVALMPLLAAVAVEVLDTTPNQPA